VGYSISKAAPRRHPPAAAIPAALLSGLKYIAERAARPRAENTRPDCVQFFTTIVERERAAGFNFLSSTLRLTIATLARSRSPAARVSLSALLATERKLNSICDAPTFDQRLVRTRAIVMHFFIAM